MKRVKVREKGPGPVTSCRAKTSCLAVTSFFITFVNSQKIKCVSNVF